MQRRHRRMASPATDTDASGAARNARAAAKADSASRWPNRLLRGRCGSGRSSGIGRQDAPRQTIRATADARRHGGSGRSQSR
jgi:hypothetical protein